MTEDRLSRRCYLWKEWGVWYFMAMPTRIDAELLTAYAEGGDPAAFAEIVSHHGPMVYGVCLRKLASRHDAEDASQAVFMALARKASRLRREGVLTGWLHTVVRQTAPTLARARAGRSHCHRKPGARWKGTELGCGQVRIMI